MSNTKGSIALATGFRNNADEQGNSQFLPKYELLEQMSVREQQLLAAIEKENKIHEEGNKFLQQVNKHRIETNKILKNVYKSIEGIRLSDKSPVKQESRMGKHERGYVTEFYDPRTELWYINPKDPKARDPITGKIDKVGRRGGKRKTSKRKISMKKNRKTKKRN